MPLHRVSFRRSSFGRPVLMDKAYMSELDKLRAKLRKTESFEDIKKSWDSQAEEINEAKLLCEDLEVDKFKAELREETESFKDIKKSHYAQAKDINEVELLCEDLEVGKFKTELREKTESFKDIKKSHDAQAEDINEVELLCEDLVADKFKAELRGKTESFKDIKKSHDAQAEDINEAKLLCEDVEVDKLKAELREKTESFKDIKKSHDSQAEDINEAELLCEDLEADKFKAELRGKTESFKDIKKSHDAQAEDINEVELLCEDVEVDKLKAGLRENTESFKDIKKSHDAQAEDINEVELLCEDLEADKFKAELREKTEYFKDIKKSHDAQAEDINEVELLCEDLEADKFKAELREKTESFKDIKKSHYAQAEDINKAKLMCEDLEVDKLKAELRKTESFEDVKKSPKAEEIKEAELLCEDLRRDLESKESIIKHISSENNKLRESYEERIKTLEDDKKALILALEEAKKEAACSSSSIPIKAANNEDEKFHKLIEEENRMEEELRVTWKKEQLENLQEEEAHNLEKQQEEEIINTNEDSDLETYTLLDDISSLQIKLHSQTKTLEQLEPELHMSKQALAREEIIRKQLETQLSEYKKVQELEPNKKESSIVESSIIEELKLENEELSVRLLVLQQAISEAKAMDGNEESDLEMYMKKLEEAYDALDRAVIELDELIYEGNQLECEVATWKLACERLKNDLERSHAKRKELEASLLSQVVFGESLKEEKIKDEQHIKEAANERVKFLETIEDKDKILKVLQKEIEWLEQEAFRREFESAVVVKSFGERTNENVKDRFIELMNERKMRMDEIMHQMTSLEEHFSNSLTTFSSMHNEDYEGEVVLPDSEAEAILQKLKNENERLMEKAQRLSSERENLIDYFLGLGDRVCEFSTVDSELMEIVGSMVESFESKQDGDDDDDDESMASEKMFEIPTSYYWG
ncbi:hypothetical protein K1719_017025 [Acacia pycnantha]|nr:hypothetical protein K1719_017025 [Acacia pycnantha]